ncbi:S1C family serine protease [Salinibacillus xinjiangensis]|uniref:PDZ domain-containing protein n=1 Tax=Salinibacillus xinjiangensis TaxID=1229268 RepID=A0A6G1XAS4_9BACI|nr:trypsin-like peptidase domain-containing protein [Salinibacillus xinjiangensis]MRG87980.1 PDZ domain-containing protein [Salinibacillus xinjiangensis]
MGYYDDHAQNHNAKKRKNWVFPTFVGFIIGVLLVFLTLPTLSNANLLPYDLTEGNEQETQGDGNDQSGVTQSVNVDIQTQVTDIVDQVSNAVVGVVSIGGSEFWLEQGNESGTGSGVIYKVDGEHAYVVSNHHVVQGASELEVSLANGERIPAELLGSDLYNDLAVLRIDASKVDNAIELGHSENLKVGEPVLAIGNPLGLQFSGSVTQGIISGKERVVPQDFNGDGVPDWNAEVIQTDAAINPGNSGGALINMKGQLIGINSMKIAQAAVEGIGFSIPIDTAKPILEDIEDDGKITRPYMGVTPRSLSEVPSYYWTYELRLPNEVKGGAVLEGVEPMSPADQAGLKELDVIVQLDEKEITNVMDLRKHLYQEKEPGEKMSVTYYRDGEKQTTTMTLSAQDF